MEAVEVSMEAVKASIEASVEATVQTSMEASPISIELPCTSAEVAFTKAFTQ